MEIQVIDPRYGRCAVFTKHLTSNFRCQRQLDHKEYHWHCEVGEFDDQGLLIEESRDFRCRFKKLGDRIGILEGILNTVKMTRIEGGEVYGERLFSLESKQHAWATRLEILETRMRIIEEEEE